MTLAAPSSGRALLTISRPTSAVTPRSAAAATASTGAALLLGFGGVERGGAHRDQLDRIGALDRGERVAGVDRTHEGVGGLDRDDVADLRHVEQRGHARQHVLARGGGRREHVAVAAGQAPDQLGDVLGGLRLVLRRVAHQHLGHAGDLGRGFGRGAAAGTRHQHMDVAAQLAGRGSRC
jgi:hypothetical protein